MRLCSNCFHCRVRVVLTNGTQKKKFKEGWFNKRPVFNRSGIFCRMGHWFDSLGNPFSYSCLTKFNYMIQTKPSERVKTARTCPDYLD